MSYRTTYSCAGMFVRIEFDKISFYLPYEEVFKDGYVNMSFILKEYNRRKKDGLTTQLNKKESEKRRRANIKKTGGSPIKL